MHPDFLSRFTTHLKETLQKALAFTIQQGRFLVEPGDLIVGIMQEQGAIANEILSRSQISVEKTLQAFSGFPEHHAPGAPVAPDLSPAVKHILEKAVLLAHVNEHKYIGTEHLLLALLEVTHADVVGFFEAQGMNIELAKEQLNNILKSTARFPDLSNHKESPLLPTEEQLQPMIDQTLKPSKNQSFRALEVFAHDLSAPEAIAKLDPVVGREEETQRLIEILCRRIKNNPILLGDPGVGKTAIVEGLAQRLANGDVPDVLQGKRILAVDLALMVAGTMYRGEFESRIKQVVEEAKNDPNIILFIDEIHNIVGAGSTSGSLDAANILKPALARGEIRCVGATTWNEFKKHIEPDVALERRFQSLEVCEPTAAATLEMLHGLKRRYEEHHGVVYSQDALETAVRLAERYLSDRFFPDKAIDLIDEAAAHVSAQRHSGEAVERLRTLDVAIEAVRVQKDEAVVKGSLDKAAQALISEQKLITEKVQLENELKKIRQHSHLEVDAKHVAQVAARMSRVPLNVILSNDRQKMTSLKKRLNKIVLGQEEAVKAVSESLNKALLGLSDPRRPKCSFMFIGPSGVGKTELARTMALEIFGSLSGLVKLDMSEYSESHSISKLLGSPAGYVGYREGNRLADTIRRHPHAVLLFDEFEKAHPDVQHILLQALEDGTITDASGRAVSLRQTYIVLTSNAGSEYIKQGSIGFGATGASNKHFEARLKEKLTEKFKPELLNRLDRIVVFKPLEREALREIVRRELDEILKRVQETRAGAWDVSENVIDWLLARDLNPDQGARAARQVVEREIVTLLSKSLNGNILKKRWKIKVDKNQLKIA